MGKSITRLVGLLAYAGIWLCCPPPPTGIVMFSLTVMRQMKEVFSPLSVPHAFRRCCYRSMQYIPNARALCPDFRRRLIDTVGTSKIS